MKKKSMMEKVSKVALLKRMVSKSIGTARCMVEGWCSDLIFNLITLIQISL